MHVWPTLPSGSVRSRVGTLMAGTIQFDVAVKGRGGHAAMPHLTRDPVVAGAAITTAIQALVSRETSPFDSAVISVTRFSAGDAYNVVPDTGGWGWALQAGGMQGVRRVGVRSRAAGMPATCLPRKQVPSPHLVLVAPWLPHSDAAPCPHAGTPPHPFNAVRLGGTMRANTDEGITQLRRRFEETVASTAAAHGCTAEVGRGQCNGRQQRRALDGPAGRRQED